MSRINFLDAGLFLRDLVLPPLCMSCHKPVRETGFLCGSCWSQVDQIEHPFCPVMGEPFRHSEGSLGVRSRLKDPSFDRIRSVVLYDDLIASVVLTLKFLDRTDLGPWLARWMYNWSCRVEPFLVDLDLVVIPVPLHRRRLFFRKFNQSAELSRNFCSLTGQSHRPDLLRRVSPTRKQVRLKMSERRKNVRRAFFVPPARAPDLRDKRVLLIDDVFTTGATLDSCCRTLRAAGAADITCFTFARVAGWHG